MLNKKIFFTLFLSITSCLFNASHGMLSEWKFPPHVQPNDPDLITMRQMGREAIEAKYYITTKRYATPEEQLWKCFDYAIASTTGFRERLEFLSGRNDITSISIEKYFDQTDKPKKNDLIVYTASEHNLTIKHFGVFIDENKVESKWGMGREIIHHDLFKIIPLQYGDAAGIFTLKEEFRSPAGRIKLVESIKKDKEDKLSKHRAIVLTCLARTSVFTASPFIVLYLLCHLNIFCIW
jgi:hypothetical protein